MNPYLIINVSLALQFFAAYLALRLIRVTGRATAWVLIAAAISFMAVRRCVTLYGWMTEGSILAMDVTTEMVALFTSGLMAVGLALIEPLFLAIKRSETKAGQSEEKYRLLVKNIPAVVFTGYGDGSVDFYDNKVEALTGYAKEEFQGRQKDWFDLIDPEDAPAARHAFVQALKTDKAYVREYRIRDKTGQPLWVQERSQIVCDTEGKINYISGVFFDITAHRLMEEKLEESERRFRPFMDHSPAAAFMKDRQGHYLYANGVCERFSQRRTEEWLGLTDYDLWPAEVAQQHRDSDEAVLAGHYPVELLAAIPNPRGELTYWSVYKFPIMPNSPEHALIGGMAVNVTEQKRAEETRVQLETQLRQSQKLEAIGRLAGGVAHDFNNLLLAIIGYGEIINLDLPPDDALRAYVEEILKAAQRGASLTSQMLAFSRKQMLQPRVLSLNEVVSGLETMLRRLIGEHIDLEIALDAGLGAIKADPGQIEQVILNLAVNARDAMPGGGKLTIETANVDLDDHYAEQHAAVVPGPYVLLAVSDTGQGMDAETQAHIFEPFFTTKENGQGTGLGLATVYGIVKQSGGDIWVYSELGQGTSFKIYLPRIEEPPQTVTAKALPSKELRGQETVLVVEDEEPVRTMLAEALHRYGYYVLEASHGAEALRIFQQHQGPIHLLITDVVMPEMSGQELAKRLAKFHPDLRVLYMSGYSNNAIVHLLAGLNFIQKPFTIAVLLEKVRQVLDA